ncbi:hypothetical protein [Bacillus coahuilensis]|uniref:hypothetical protein n=1 Tax=Bacillus coahuilensis TaxID=408580 RepID=UPI000750C0ED|nr:hypothetical protein [Bacillus coahuilensis]
MSFGFDFDFDLVSFIFTIFAWVAIGYIGFRIYRLQEQSPKIWKIVLVILIGIFSFSINFPVGSMVIHLYILPLGV